MTTPTVTLSAPGSNVSLRLWQRSLLIALGGLATLFVVLVLATESADATHYRYGTLNWEPTENANEVEFNGAQAWRRSFFGAPALGDEISIGALDFGDGGSANLCVQLTSINTVNDWFFGNFVDCNTSSPVRHTYATPNNGGAPWQVNWNSCCRISPASSGNFHINNPDLAMRLETHIDLSSDNASPKTNLPPINSCPQNAICTIPVPFVDPDADALSFRLSNTAESGDAGFVQPGPADAPNAATINPTTGVITWDTTGATFNGVHTLYSMQVMLEDDETRTPLDFFIELIPVGTAIPEWDPITVCGTTIEQDAGTLFTFPVKAFSTDAARVITLNHLGLPPGATFPLPAPGNPVQSTFTWTPSQDEAGTFIVIFTAVDDLGFSAPACPITLVAKPHPPPEFLPPSPCVSGNVVQGIEEIPFTFGLAASTPNASRTVTLSLISGPPGLVLLAGPPGNPTAGTASWPSPVEGDFTAVFQAQDNVGLKAKCTAAIHIVRPDGQSLDLGVWAGTAVPLTVEYQTQGVDLRDEGAQTNEPVIVDLAAQGIYAEALEEHGDVDIAAGVVTSNGWIRVEELRLQGSLVVLEGLENKAQVVYNLATHESQVTESNYIAKLTVNGLPVVVPPAPTGEVEVPLPGGGKLVLFERDLVQTPNGITLRSNLIHVYNSLAYGREEVIVGGLVLQGRADPVFFGEERLILPQDDANSGGDAGNTLAAALGITPGAYDASTPGDDRVDVYSFAAAHGEKITFTAQPGSRATATGGFLLVEATPPPLAAVPSTTVNPLVAYSVRLYDPTNTEREASILLGGGAPARVELNADLPGTWRAEVQRLTHPVLEANYTLALTVTPLVLLPQAEGLTLADAPGACGAAGTPTIQTGLWPGVVRDNDFADVYRFDARIGEVVVGVLKPGEDADGVDMALTLYDQNCSVLSHSDSSLVKGVPELALRLPALYTGSYFLGVERINGVGNYYLSLAIVNPLPTLPNNDAGTGSDAPNDPANAVAAPPLAFEGRLDDGDAGDAYKMGFVSAKRTQLAFHMSATSTAQVVLKTPTGATITPFVQNAVGAQVVVFNFVAPETGDYVLTIQPTLGGGNYLVEYASSPVS